MVTCAFMRVCPNRSNCDEWFYNVGVQCMLKISDIIYYFIFSLRRGEPKAPYLCGVCVVINTICMVSMTFTVVLH